MADEMNWDEAAKYLADEGTPMERAAFERWIAERPERRELIATLTPHMARREPPAVDVDAAWNRLAARLDRERFTVADGPSRSADWPRLVRIPWAAVAAAAVVIAAVLVPTWLASRTPATAPLSTFATAAGEQRSVTLSDGSRLILAPTSSLQAHVSGSGRREVELSGEALFTVRHDPARPFVVRAGGATIEDLGTVFAVRALPSERSVRVAVREGVVAFRTGDAEQLVLRAGDVGVTVGDTPARDATSVATATSWTRGELVFVAEPLVSVAAELTRWYDVALEVDPAMRARTVTVTFAGESLEEMLTVLERTLDARVERRGAVVLIAPK